VEKRYDSENELGLSRNEPLILVKNMSEYGIYQKQMIFIFIYLIEDMKNGQLLKNFLKLLENNDSNVLPN
jgi:hypothetical protein